MKLLAKSSGQTLKTHLLAVGLMTLNNIREIGFGKVLGTERYSSLQIYGAIAGLLHDVGKVDSKFQNRVSGRYQENAQEAEENDNITETAFKGPFHHEISWVIFNRLFREPQVLSILGKSDFNPYSIGHTIYWHHGANFDTKSDNNAFMFPTARDIINETESFDDILIESEKLIKTVFDEFHQKSGIDPYLYLSPRKEFEPSMSVPSFSTNVIANLALDFEIGDESIKKGLLYLMIKADIEISKMTEEEALFYIENFKLSDAETSLDTEFNESLFNISGARTQGQVELAKKINQKRLSICGVDTGSGKTLLSILATQLRKTTIILPKINQVDALDIQGNLKLVSDKEVIVQRIHSKSEDDRSNNNYNYRLMVFDSAFSGLFDRKNFELSTELLSTDLVIDEFHEFSTIPQMIIPLRVFLMMRRLVNKKTVLLSGTPDLALLDLVLGKDWKNNGSIGYFQRSSLEPLSSGEHKKIRIKLTETSKVSTNISSEEENALVSTNSILSAQLNYLEYRKDKILCHSNFTSKDIKDIMSNISSMYSKGPLVEKRTTVYTSKMLNSSYDFAFKRIYSEVSIPSIDIQLMGRCNRFQKIGDAEKILHYDPNGKYGLITMAYRMEKTHKKWIAFLRDLIPEEGLELTHREIGEKLYDAFFENKDNLEEYKRDLYKNALWYFDGKNKTKDSMLNWFPIKMIRKKKRKDEGIFVSKYGFRGRGMVVSVSEVDENGNFLRQLSKDDCLSLDEAEERRDFERLTLKVDKKIPKNSPIREWFTGQENKYKRVFFGSNSNSPILLSLMEHETSDNLLRDELEDSGSYMLYNKKLGLFSKKKLGM